MLAEIGQFIWIVLVFLWNVLVWLWNLLMWFLAWLWNLLFPRKPVKNVDVEVRSITDLERRSLMIAFSAYFSTEWLGDQNYIESHTKETLGEFLQREDVAELVVPTPEGKKDGKNKAYELVWGPAVFQSKASMIADNTMFVAREISDHSKLYIGVAGTHPLSLFSWLFHDFDVFSLVEWPYARRTEEFFRVMSSLKSADSAASPSATEESAVKENAEETVSAQVVDAIDTSANEGDEKLLISKGTFRALKTLIAMQDPTTGTPLVRFLSEQCEAFQREHENDPEAKIEITVTGHSLGGALCHALALYLHDNASVWNDHNRAHISCVSFAGPTIGNRTLARYYDACLGDSSYRVANSYDIVPLAWDTEYMSAMYHIYEPYISTPMSFEILLQIFISAIASRHYGHVCDKQKFFVGPKPNPKNEWTPEMMAQHSKSYFTHFELNNLAVIIAEHAPIFREAFCDGTFTSDSMKTVYSLVANKITHRAEVAEAAQASGADVTTTLKDDDEEAEVEVVAGANDEPKHTFASSVLIYANMLKDNLISASDVVKDNLVSLSSTIAQTVGMNGEEKPEEPQKEETEVSA